MKKTTRRSFEFDNLSQATPFTALIHTQPLSLSCPHQQKAAVASKQACGRPSQPGGVKPWGTTGPAVPSAALPSRPS